MLVAVVVVVAVGVAVAVGVGVVVGVVVAVGVGVVVGVVVAVAVGVVVAVGVKMNNTLKNDISDEIKMAGICIGLLLLAPFLILKILIEFVLKGIFNKLKQSI